MNETENLRWSWEKTDPDRSQTSGDVSKLFKNEPVKAPGVFAADQPSPDATVLAREVIQNAWDAAAELRADAAPPPQFEISFTFRSVAGGHKHELIGRLGLHELAERVTQIDDRRSIGLRSSDCLNSLNDDSEFTYLVIQEQAASGMHGPWKGDRSKLFRALLAIGYTNEEGDTGGSFGYGKAGLIRGSAIRTVITYTCFRERDDDSGITRRLLGMSYWGPHHLGDDSFTGFARYGQGPEGILPFENEDADMIAAKLGVRRRDPAQVEDLGTTTLLIEPTVEPEDLCKAIERSWWPALEDKALRFNAVIYRYDATELHPKPKKNKVLKTFIDSYEAATTQGQSTSERKRYEFRKIGRFSRPGTLGLVADKEGWSYAEQTEGDTEIEHRSLIALVRKPRMVVEYLEAGRTPPHIRGTFVADSTINEVLRATEPKGHDTWSTNLTEGDLNQESAKVAKDIINRIKYNVRRFREELKPPSRPPESVDLPHFDKIMKRLMSGKGQSLEPPIYEQRPLSINVDCKPVSVTDELIECSGTVQVAFSEHFEEEEAPIEIAIRYRILEDERGGAESFVLITPPFGFSEEVNSGLYIGMLRQGDVARFEFCTEPYRADWTGRLYVNADIDQAKSREQ